MWENFPVNVSLCEPVLYYLAKYCCGSLTEQLSVYGLHSVITGLLGVVSIEQRRLFCVGLNGATESFYKHVYSDID